MDHRSIKIGDGDGVQIGEVIDSDVTDDGIRVTASIDVSRIDAETVELPMTADTCPTAVLTDDEQEQLAERLDGLAVRDRSDADDLSLRERLMAQADDTADADSFGVVCTHEECAFPNAAVAVESAAAKAMKADHEAVTGHTVLVWPRDSPSEVWA